MRMKITQPLALSARITWVSPGSETSARIAMLSTIEGNACTRSAKPVIAWSKRPPR
jgi:hypothetical protein